MPRERRRVFFSGRVQGVGFRFRCQAVARGFEVAGHVRNLPDGRVEVLAEGDAPEIDAFLAAVRQEFDGYITAIAANSEPAGASPLAGFSIRY
jgi:acylphosphatase